MDTVTHGIVGALIGKAFFAESPSPLAPNWRQRPTSPGRVAIISATLGAIFPDIDIIAGAVAHNDMALLTWHRSITHSLVILPLWALLLATLTWWLARRIEWPAPPWGTLVLIYAVGVGSHIFLDLATSFGTMIWSPVDYSRPAWDWVFIVDLSFTALVLLPQLAAWGFRGRKVAAKRSIALWAICTAIAFVIVLGAQRVGLPVATVAAPLAAGICAMFFLLPLRHGTGTRVGRGKWCRIGVALAGAYLTLAALQHKAAMDRTLQFAQFAHLDVQGMGALPLPPTLSRWAGLIQTPEGVYRLEIDDVFTSGPANFRLFRNAEDNRYIDEARQLRDVQTFLWFARFPVFRFSMPNGQPTVRITDLRFLGDRPGQPRGGGLDSTITTGTFEVVFTPDGRVVSEGRLRPD